MKKERFHKYVYLFVLLIILSGKLYAANWYVNSTNGHDIVFDGTSSSTAFATIAKAISMASAGDKILIAGGTYTESIINMNKILTFETYEFQGTVRAIISNGIQINANVTFTAGLFQTSLLKLLTARLTTGTENLVLPIGSTVEIINGTISSVPFYEGLINLKYTPTENYIMGPEVPADFNGGWININVPATKVLTTGSGFSCKELITSGAGTLKLGADMELTGSLNNGIASFNLGGFTFNWSPTANLSVANAILGTILNGTFKLGGTKNITCSATTATLPNLFIPAAYQGVFKIQENLTVDDFTLGADQADAFILGGKYTLDIKGDFNRTDNTVGNFNIVDNEGLLKFSGTIDATFDPGANLTVYDLEIGKTSSTISMDASVVVENNVTVSSGSLDLDAYIIKMTGYGGVFSNGGAFYSSALSGYVAFENETGIGGIAATVSGAGTFGNILVNLQNASDKVRVGSNLEISGVLWLYNGFFDIAGAYTVYFTNSNVAHPTIKIFTTGNNTEFINSGGGALIYSTDVSLWYYGTSNYNCNTKGIEWSSLAQSANFYNLNIEVTGSTVTGFADLASISGNLYVGSGSTLEQGPFDYILDGDNKIHTILGTVKSGELTVLGKASVLNGDPTATGAAKINDLEIAVGTAGNFQSTNIKSIRRITHTSGPSFFSMNESAANVTDINVTGGTLTFDPGAGVITKDLSITANGKIILGDDISVGNNIIHSGNAIVDMGEFDIYLANNYTHSDNAIFESITSGNTMAIGSGRMIATASTDGLALFTLNTKVIIPNLEINSTGGIVQLIGNDLEVSKSFYLTDGVFDLNGNDIIISGDLFEWDVTSPASFNTSGSDCNIKLKGNNLNIFPIDESLSGNNPSFTTAANLLNVIIDSEGSVTFGTDGRENKVGGNPYIFDVEGLFTQLKGDVALGINQLRLKNGLDRTTGNWSQGIAQEDGWGFIVFDGGAFNSGNNFAIDNLWIESSTNNLDDVPYTINKVLWLNKGVLTQNTDGNITIGDGGWIWRSDGSIAVSNLGDQLSWGANANIWYRTDDSGTKPLTAPYNVGLEWPAAPVIVQQVIINNNGVNVILQGDRNVASFLSLYDGTLDVNNKLLTLGGGATLTLTANGKLNLTGTNSIFNTTNYHLVYTGNENIITNVNALEFPEASDKILSLTVDMKDIISGIEATDKGLFLNSDNTILTDVFINSGFIKLDDNINDAYFRLTVGGDLFFGTNGSIADTKTRIVIGHDRPTLIFNGSNEQELSGWIMPDGVDANGDKDFDDIGDVPPHNMIINNTSCEGLTSAADITMGFGGILYLTSGVLNMGDNTLTLWHMDDGIEPVQGYERSINDTGEPSHVVGKIKKFLDATSALGANASIALTRVEYPLGTDCNLGNLYCPVALQFTTLPTAGINVTIEYSTEILNGNVGLPLETTDFFGNPMWLETVNDFHWEMTSSLTLQPHVEYDVEMAAAGYDGYIANGIANVRLLRRYVGSDSNPWVLQGGASYDNSIDTEGTPKVIVRDAQGAISQQGAIFTYSDVTTAVPVGTEELQTRIPNNYILDQNYPNPFNPATTIRFGLPNDANVVLKVYNLLGQEIATLVNNYMNAGYHEISFNASELHSGFYIYKIEAGKYTSAKKMILLK